MRKLLFIAVLATAFGSYALAQDQQKIRIATEGAYAPWNFTEGGKLAGFDIDLVNDLCARMKAECTIEAQNFDGLIPSLNAGKFDAIVAAMNSTPKRKEAIAFSRPYAVEPVGMVAPKDSPVASVADTGKKVSLSSSQDAAQTALSDIKQKLAGKTVGVMGSTAFATFVDKYLKDAVTVREYKTTEELDLDLSAGRIDAAFNGSAAIAATLAKPGYENFMQTGPLFSGDVLGDGFAAGIRKEDRELKAKFDQAIGDALADGTIKALSEKWIKADLSPAN